MLNKRAQILFDEKTWEDLSKLAKKQKTSVGELTRKAIKQSYFSDDQSTQMKEAFETIMRLRPKRVKGKIDYKALINDGRKY